MRCTFCDSKAIYREPVAITAYRFACETHVFLLDNPRAEYGVKWSQGDIRDTEYPHVTESAWNGSPACMASVRPRAMGSAPLVQCGNAARRDSVYCRVHQGVVRASAPGAPARGNFWTRSRFLSRVIGFLAR